MKNGVNVLESARHCLRITDVAAEEFHVTRKICRPPARCAMYLRRETIERPNVVAILEQVVSKMRSDKTRPSSN
jgi:hypothetical protein